MIRPLIMLKKYLYIKPKWRILVIFTKKIQRHKLVDLKKAIEKEISVAEDEVTKAYLKGKWEIINLLLK